MIRQQAFENASKMLKGGLHCHTTRSDGSGDPAEVIRLHSKNGYDFLALTDHRIYNFTNFAPETGLTVIPGMEYDATFEKGNGFRCFHTVCIGPSKEDGNGFGQDERAPKIRITCQEEYQPFLDLIHEKKNLTVYCHPQWSSTPARYFDKLKGNFAIEVWNSGCAMDCRMDMDAPYWDELLGQGIKIYGVAVDDGHGMNQHCRGWVRVNAENDINSILAALRDGKFYSSCGPEIYDFYADGETLCIDCSEAKEVIISSDMHPSRVIKAGEKPLTHVEFGLKHWEGPYRYVRATVIDRYHKYAWTNPIWLEA
ncbi:MAG: CehA/McbA family metallohydrolase [Clostridia bacterium]|nr:CehA/McbA family metallohydrolase [Clostridia bacterium]